MARLSKDCPKCKKKQPVEVKLVPPPLDAPGTEVRYEATCKACGHVHAPDSTEIVRDGKAWAAERRAKFGRVM